MKRILPGLAVAVLILLVYAPALPNAFVWDDTALILRDPLIRSWRLIPEGFAHFLFTDATASDFYRPIQRLTYTLDYWAFGFKPFGYHLSSVAWHVAAALALLLLANELLRFLDVEKQKRRWIALAATILWAIHPVHSAAVAYISGRADPLAAMFGFTGLYCGIRSLRTTGGTRVILLMSAGGLFLLSALSKEAGLIFLLLWSALLILKKRWKELLRATVVVLFVSTIYLSLRLTAERVPPPVLRPPAPLLVKPIVTARAVAEYAGLLLLPINLHMDRDVETRPRGEGAARADSAAWRELQTILGLLLAAGMVGWLLRARKRDVPTYSCLILAIITYLPISGLFPLNATVAEHWIYLPAAFLFLAGALSISRLSLSPMILGPVLGMWLLFLGARTWIRTLDWKDQRTFLESTIASGGDSVRMWINLAGLEINEGRLDTAKEHLSVALAEQPDQPLAVLHLATIAMRQEDLTTARDLLNRATKMPLIEARAHELLALLDQKENGRADLLRFRLAARTGPPNWAIEKRYVEALDQSGETDTAISELKTCLATQWYRAESWQLLSRLLTKAGHPVAAAQANARAKAYDVHLDWHPAL